MNTQATKKEAQEKSYQTTLLTGTRLGATINTRKASTFRTSNRIIVNCSSTFFTIHNV